MTLAMAAAQQASQVNWIRDALSTGRGDMLQQQARMAGMLSHQQQQPQAAPAFGVGGAVLSLAQQLQPPPAPAAAAAAGAYTGGFGPQGCLPLPSYAPAMGGAFPRHAAAGPQQWGVQHQQQQHDPMATEDLWGLLDMYAATQEQPGQMPGGGQHQQQ
jgi:hypothetical protein